MLGKGLESLIPPNQGNRHNAGQTPNADNNAGMPRQAAAPQQPASVPAQPPANNGASNFSSVPLIQNSVQHQQIQQPQKKKNKEPENIGSVFHIEIEKIKPNPQQPRRQFEEEALKDLASSIREFGILQPITVTKIEKETPNGTDVEYQLIAGERRWLASKMLGLELIPAIIRNIDLERERLELAIIENIQREDLNPIERARSFAKLQDEFRLTQREIAVRLGKSRESIANTVRLLDLPAAITEALEKNQISESHGRLLLAIEDPGTQERIFRELLEKRMTTRDLKNKVRGFKPEIKKEAREEVSPEIKMMQEKLSSELGAPVRIESEGERGKITITFFSPEELQNIVDKFGNEENQASL
ncbi:MAG TPA: ParB/RepB/Spo0J family partition protein [Candidatus Paceibacterota bacterium]|nr:ParB/RepB/Spo0J family partition protein [Candidatus Paceibacterota bacterium]